MLDRIRKLSKVRDVRAMIEEEDLFASRKKAGAVARRP
jgi:hypothetical protein